MQRFVAAAGLLVAVFASVVAVRVWLGERSLAQGTAARRRGDFNAADAAYRAASTRGNADAATERARLHLLRRDWNGVGESLREAMALAPTRAFPHILQASLEIDGPGQWDEAREERVIRECRTAVSLEPGRSAIRSDAADALLRMVTLRRSHWDTERVRTVIDAATTDFAEALARDPGAARDIFARMLDGGADPDVLLEVAVRSGSVGSLPALVRLLMDRDLWAGAAPALWIAAEKNGILPALAAAASDMLARSARFREALAAARLGLSAAPADVVLSARAADAAARLPGSEALAAVPLYRAAVAADPDNFELRRRFAAFLAARELFLEAENEVRTLLGNRIHDAGAWFLLGELLRRSGRIPEAAVAYREAVALRPDNAVYRRAAGIDRR